MKRKFFVISVIIVISLVTMAGFIVNAVSKSSVVFTPMGIAKNRALWDQFKENAKALTFSKCHINAYSNI